MINRRSFKRQRGVYEEDSNKFNIKPNFNKPVYVKTTIHEECDYENYIKKMDNRLKLVIDSIDNMNKRIDNVVTTLNNNDSNHERILKLQERVCELEYYIKFLENKSVPKYIN